MTVYKREHGGGDPGNEATCTSYAFGAQLNEVYCAMHMAEVDKIKTLACTECTRRTYATT